MRPRRLFIRGLFSRVARRYDLANRVFTCGLDGYWRRSLVRMASLYSPKVVVDLATGSGLVAFALKRCFGPTVSVTGIDFCLAMLDRAEERNEKKEEGLVFQEGDCMALSLERESVDLVTVSFGIRNFEDRLLGFREMYRILQPQGVALILEFSAPKGILRFFYRFYLRRILPILALLITREKEAYDYLVDSIENFPSSSQIVSELREVGFQSVVAVPFTGGIVTIYRAEKNRWPTTPKY